MSSNNSESSNNDVPSNDCDNLRLNPLYYRELLVDMAEVVSRASGQINIIAPHPCELHIKNELTEDFGIILKRFNWLVNLSE